MTREEKFMKAAIDMAAKGIENGEGGPFGCVIVKGDVIVGRGNNRVIADNDPTAHAEIVAIRDACKKLDHFHLTDCEIYASCEPCPMCLGAIYWARIKIIYYASDRYDAAGIGFDDSFIYHEMNNDFANRKIPMIALNKEEAIKVFNEWKDKNNTSLY